MTKNVTEKTETKEAVIAEIYAMLLHGDDRLSYEYQRELRKRLKAILSK